MNLTQLRFALAVASTGSFTAAARQCHVTQPTLSNGIAQLEAELGARLFHRTTRAVGLTPFGEHVLAGIRDVIDAQQALVLRARSFSQPETRLIRIGTSPLVDAAILRPLLDPFRRQHPEVEIVLREMNMADLDKRLDAGQLDFVFGVAETTRPPRETAALYDEPLVYIPPGGASTDHRSGTPVRFVDIASALFVMVPDACGLARVTRAMFRAHRRPLKTYSGEAMSYQVLEQWASLGIGAAILPLSKLSSARASALRLTDKSGQNIHIAFQATWSTHTTHADHLQRFAEHLRDVVPRVAAGLHLNP